MQRMIIAITGSNGYVGNFLAEYLSQKGYAVIGLDITSDERQKSFLNFKFFTCDVRDYALVQRIFENEKVAVVIHLAYLMEPQHNRAFEDDVDSNGSIAVFLAAHDTSSVQQFIHFSSASVYGGWKNNPVWISEEHPVRPRDWVYAQNKKVVEEFYDHYTKREDFCLVNLRMCTAVGPSYYKKGGVVKTVYSSPLGLLLNNRDTTLQFIHEEDVKRIIELIINDAVIEGTFNLAPDSYATTRELNAKKLFVPFPKKLFKTVIRVLWHLRLISVSPTAVNLIAHGIVISPRKLIERYTYRFLYATKEAYDATVRERLRKGTL